jgi:hypothetical protein
MAHKFYKEIDKSEFENPTELSQEIVDIAYDIRMRLGRPMFFTNTRTKGRHPHGDAVPPNSRSHSKASLHKFGIDHNESARRGLVIPGSFRGMALDFDIVTEDFFDFLDLYLQISGMGVSGVGIYPDWNNPGYHIDCRRPNHPGYLARWWCYTDKDDSTNSSTGKSKTEYRNITSREIDAMFDRYSIVNWKTKKRID